MSTGPARILFDESAILLRVKAMAAEVALAAPQNLLAVPVMTGAFVFAADFLRALHGSGLAPQVDFLQIGSYGGGKASSGKVELLRDFATPVEGRDVLIVDDILETGRTLLYAKELFLSRGARRALIAVLLEKPHKREVEISADFVGFPCPDRFVVGYGMDHAGNFRQWPFIGALDGM